MDDSLKTKPVELKGRRFEIRVFLYDGELIEAVPFENDVIASLRYPGGTAGRPLYQVCIDPTTEVDPAMVDHLIDIAEADLRRLVA